jgi:hypothetical protein
MEMYVLNHSIFFSEIHNVVIIGTLFQKPIICTKLIVYIIICFEQYWFFQGGTILDDFVYDLWSFTHVHLFVQYWRLLCVLRLNVS